MGTHAGHIPHSLIKRLIMRLHAEKSRLGFDATLFSEKLRFARVLTKVETFDAVPLQKGSVTPRRSNTTIHPAAVSAPAGSASGAVRCVAFHSMLLELCVQTVDQESLGAEEYVRQSTGEDSVFRAVHAMRLQSWARNQLRRRRLAAAS